MIAMAELDVAYRQHHHHLRQAGYLNENDGARGRVR